MYTNIFLDADDTLLDFQKAQFCSFKEVLLNYNISYSEEVYNKYVEINHKLWNDFEQGEISKDDIQSSRFHLFFQLFNKDIDGFEANMIYQRNLEQQTWLTPYAKEVCEELSKKCTLTIVTNGVGKTQTQRITSSEIHPYISHIVISEEIGIAKPDKRFFEFAFNLIDCSNLKEILLVGDSLSSDIQGANNANIDACWFNPSMHSLTKNLSIRYTISDLRQLLQIV